MAIKLMEVSGDEFYRAIGRQNVHPRIINDRFPYTSEWRLQDSSQRMIGKTVGRNEGGYAYFLCEAEA